MIGCGGKTALANRLAMENRRLPVLLSTTTRMLMPPEQVIDRRVADAKNLLPGVNLLYEGCEGKLSGVSNELLESFYPLNGVMILEADGSRGLPLKGWTEYEPVIPAFVSMTVGVCVVWPVGLPCSEKIIHRLALFKNITDAIDGEIITINHIASMVHEMMRKAIGRRVVFINQIETAGAMALAHKLTERCPGMRFIAGSVREGTAVLLSNGDDDV